MDAELREAFREMNVKIDVIHKDIQDHLIEDVRCATELRLSISAQKEILNGHLDDHKESKKWWLALWGGVIAALAGNLWQWIKGR